MSLQQACQVSGYNSGTAPCLPTKGVPKYIAEWKGKITAAELAQGDLVSEAVLVAHSKKSKTSSSKLVLWPIIRDPQNKKAANTTVSTPDGYEEVTREGLPAYDFKMSGVNPYQASQLRKGNNLNTNFAVVDDKLQFWGILNSDGDLVGDTGQIYAPGVDFQSYDKLKGEMIVSLRALTTNSYDNAACIFLSSSPDLIFKSLKDIQLYEKVAATHSAGTKASATATITNVGADGDTLDVLLGSDSLVAAPVIKTSSETTVTLLAAKVVTAINDATATNGGFTATNVAGVITVQGSTENGASLNTLTLTITPTGTIAASSTTAFTGGVNSNTTLHISGKMGSSLATVTLDFYGTASQPEYGASALGTDKTLWKPTTIAGVAVVPASVAPNAAGYFDLAFTALPVGSYIINLDTPDVLDAANVRDIEAIPFTYTKGS